MIWAFWFQVRQFVSDFAVIIAIVSMSLLDYLTNIPTPKLEVRLWIFLNLEYIIGSRNTSENKFQPVFIKQM